MEARIWLAQDDGMRLALLDDVTRFHYVKAINGVGSFYISLPAGRIDDLLRVDRMIQFWPKKADGYQFDFLGFLRLWGWRTTDQGITIVRLIGPCQNDLLRRRRVAYAAGSSQAGVTGSTLVDDGMKDIFNENFLSGATGARNIASLGVTVAPDLGAGPNLDKRFAWRRVINVLQDLNAASRAAGTEVYFYLTVSGLDERGRPSFDFRTYTGQPGQDRTWGNHDDPIIVGLDYGNLQSPDLENDWRETENHIYAGGQGEESDRNIQEVSDSGRIAESAWNRCEGFADARNEETDAEVQAAGYARLGEYQPSARFTGYLLSTEQTPYGSWELGDRVTVIYQGQRIDGVIRRVEVQGDVTRGITARGYIEEEL
jgi:hypothetical protein